MGTTRWLGRIVVILGCAVVVAAPLAPASARPRVLAPARAALEIQVKAGADAFRVPIVNSSRLRPVVRVRLVVTKRLKGAVDTTSGPKRLKRSSVSKIRFPFRVEEPPSGTFSAIVLVKSANTRRILDRRRVRLVVPGATQPPAAQPAVTTLDVEIRANWPWGGLESPCGQDAPSGCLPLVPPAANQTLDTSKLTKGKTLAALSGGSAGHLFVHWTGETVTLPSSAGDTSALQLEFSGNKHPGKYEGTLDLYPADPDNPTVAISVVLEHEWWLALIALVLGVGLAVFVRRRLGLGHKVSLLKSDAGEADLAFECGQDAPPGSDSFSGYSITAERVLKRGEMWGQIREVEALLAIELSADDPAYKAAVSNIETMKTSGKSWCAFKDELRELQAALDPLRVAFDAGTEWKKAKPVAIDDDCDLMPDGPARPRWFDDAQELATPPGTTELDFETLEATRTRVKKATALAKSWRPLMEQLESLDCRIALIEEKCVGLGEAEAKALTAAKMSLSEARWELWAARDADDLERRTSQLDLAEAERNVARLTDCLRAEVEVAPKIPAALYVVAAIFEGSIGPKVLARLAEMPEVADLPAPDDPAAVIRWESANRRLINRLVLWILVGALLYAGMKALYFDDDVFGTWRDYADTLVWGLGSVAVLDTFSSQLDKMRERRNV